VDRADSHVRYTAPAAGRIAEVNRGPKRRLLSIVIEIEGDKTVNVSTGSSGELAALSRDRICETLLASGLWPALRSRPYGRVAATSGLPTALFVTAIDTNPLAADPGIIVRDRADDFVAGLAVVSRLAPATYVCAAPGADLPSSDVEGVVVVEFAGKHPTGLVGTHVRHLHPEASEVWHIGYQDVLAIGHLFTTGVLSTERVISLAGPGVHRPRLVRTRLGADLHQLLEGEIAPGCRVVSGSLLDGRAVTPAICYLGRYHDQVSVVPDAVPGEERPSFRAALRGLLLQHPFRHVPRSQSTATHGLPSGMLAVEDFDRVWPFAAPPGPLLRALLIRDTETASALGCLALTEEDMALCSYVCPAKLDYGSALRETLREIERGR
jgi:Na+-transporting NADH:ubiquinone oxidoreductase subunit A